MPNYTTVVARMDSYGNAASLLPKLQQIYRQAQEVDDAITLYQAGTDSHFNTAINSIFSTAERTELGAMLENLQTLTSAWAAQHSTLLGAGE